MSDSTTLTLDQAAAMMPDDASETAVAYDDDYSSVELHRDEPSVPAESDRLTIDQAVDQFADDDGDQQKVWVRPDTPVAVIDGRELTVSDMVADYERGRRYSQAVTVLQDQFETVQNAAQGVVNGAWQLAGFLVQHMPGEPDSRLAQMNPAAYTAQKEAYENAYQHVIAVLSQGEEARGHADYLTHEYHGHLLESEGGKLVDHFPECAERQGRERFFDIIRRPAYECGFTEEELRQVLDHRLFRLAHLAALGMERQQHRQKQEDRPKRRRRNKHRSDALDRLSQTGSLEDALAVDFD